MSISTKMHSFLLFCLYLRYVAIQSLILQIQFSSVQSKYCFDCLFSSLAVITSVFFFVWFDRYSILSLRLINKPCEFIYYHRCLWLFTQIQSICDAACRFRLDNMVPNSKDAHHHILYVTASWFLVKRSVGLYFILCVFCHRRSVEHCLHKTKSMKERGEKTKK